VRDEPDVFGTASSSKAAPASFSIGILVRMNPDREYVKRLTDAEADFWRRVTEDHWPETVDDELDLSTDPKWRRVALGYREARARIEAAAAEEHKLREILKGMANARRTYGCGVEGLKKLQEGSGRLFCDSRAVWRQP
jgi:hypothetical protein